MAKKDVKNLKKDAFDLEGNVIRTTAEEEAIARQELDAQRAKQEADKGTSKDVEESERKRLDLEGNEIDPKAATAENNVESTESTEDAEAEVEEESTDTEDTATDETESESADVKADDEATESDEESAEAESTEDADESATEEATTESTESAESTEAEEVAEEVKETKEVEAEAETEVVEETKETGDFETRMTKMEEKMDKILAALSKGDESEAEEATTEEAETEEVEEAAEEEVTEPASSEEVESEKADKAEMTKVDSLEQLTKIEGELEIAKQEIAKRENEIAELKKMAKPSKILSPFAIAKGMEFFSEPESELTKINDRLAEIDEIKKNSPALYTGDRKLQEEAFRLVKTKKDIEYQLS